MPIAKTRQMLITAVADLVVTTRFLQPDEDGMVRVPREKLVELAELTNRQFPGFIDGCRIAMEKMEKTGRRVCQDL